MDKKVDTSRPSTDREMFAATAEIQVESQLPESKPDLGSGSAQTSQSSLCSDEDERHTELGGDWTSRLQNDNSVSGDVYSAGTQQAMTNKVEAEMVPMSALTIGIGIPVNDDFSLDNAPGMMVATRTSKVLPAEVEFDEEGVRPGAFSIQGIRAMNDDTDSDCGSDGYLSETRFNDERTTSRTTVRTESSYADLNSDQSTLVEAELVDEEAQENTMRSKILSGAIMAEKVDNVRSKKRRMAVRFLAGFILIAVIAIVLGVVLSRRSANRTPMVVRCIKSGDELRSAVDDYLRGGSDRNRAIGLFGATIGSWCVSRISDFDRVFSAERNPLAASFNEPLAGWDVSSATRMREMFLNATLFNHDVENWNVSRVTDVSRMFYGASSFRQDLCSWLLLLPGDANRTNVVLETNCAVETDPVLGRSRLSEFFCSFCTPQKCIGSRAEFLKAVDEYLIDSARGSRVAAIYGHPIRRWCFSDVITDLSGLFSAQRNPLSESFNEDVSTWDVSNVVTMKGMFQGSFDGRECQIFTRFNQSLATWNTSKVTDLSYMFQCNAAFDQPLTSWATSQVKTVESMFANTLFFDQPLAGWNTSSLEVLHRAFFNSKFNQPIGAWDVRQVRDMRFMFAYNPYFNQDLSSWDTSSVETMRGMFAESWAFNHSLSSWNTSNVESMMEMFSGARDFNQPLDGWNVSNVVSFRSFMDGATSFRHNLCRWASAISNRSDVDVELMFQGSACEDPSSPDLTRARVSPLCTVC